MMYAIIGNKSLIIIEFGEEQTELTEVILRLTGHGIDSALMAQVDKQVEFVAHAGEFTGYCYHVSDWPLSLVATGHDAVTKCRGTFVKTPYCGQ